MRRSGVDGARGLPWGLCKEEALEAGRGEEEPTRVNQMLVCWYVLRSIVFVEEFSEDPFEK